MNINWLTERVEFPADIDKERCMRWLDAVAAAHGKICGTLTYIFTDDEGILKVNREFLQHDYYTDIITFDYSKRRMVSGDIYISLDTVRSNAAQFSTDPVRELHRVVAHGLLHLCGIDDKGPGEREIMEAHENDALNLLDRTL
ncbi:MAG: rRNA maturation RNase YbeY [Muribaculaceae bacterium]|nr:rRNA maturation RNase YbeY [Muribaculaceae bacterium]MDE6462444.1 rRNA maturation RNase YbeY [Muribaculaceae bacterium]MDE6510102.1 rRNA maturation RNase YbeY [Muribaculaceae bacterium]